MDEGEDDAKASFRDGFARLAEVKRQHDPGDSSLVDPNIRPA